MKRNILLAMIITALVAFKSNAQKEERRFKAGLMVGASFSQIDGDLQQGYNKASPSLGLRGGFRVLPNFDINTELFYNQRGTTPKDGSNKVSSENINTDLNLRYADVLAVANFHLMPSSDLTYYKQTLQLGITYGRLLSSTVDVRAGSQTDIALENKLKQSLNTNDFGVVLGWAWNINSRTGVQVRHTVSLNKLYDSPIDFKSDTQYSDFRPYYFTVHLFYNFISPKLNLEKVIKKKKEKMISPLDEI